MYLNFYQLQHKPFQITTDPKFLWLGDKHKEALATLKYGIMEDKGFLLLTGDVGTGKTALIKLLVKTINVSAVVATLPDPGLEPLDFFNILAEEFKMERRFASKGDFLIEFKQFLLKANLSQQKVLLIIDEAQRLTVEMLEQVRLLSNIELENRKLINIFFVGQTEFNRTLLDERSKALRQRITVSYYIEPLIETETRQYILHRLKVAGAGREIFTPDAMLRVHAFSQGYPRLINIICDHALLTGYASGVKTIDVNLIRECEKELRLPEMRDPRDPVPRAPSSPLSEEPSEDLPAAKGFSWRVPIVLVFLLLWSTNTGPRSPSAGPPRSWPPRHTKGSPEGRRQPLPMRRLTPRPCHRPLRRWRWPPPADRRRAYRRRRSGPIPSRRGRSSSFFPTIQTNSPRMC
ncbi:MAG: AAA family ATPase [Desulfobacterales bacterium]|nr:AAA family ATPase [Desulfobacterales bacterium]